MVCGLGGRGLGAGGRGERWLGARAVISGVVVVVVVGVVGWRAEVGME